jgi:CHAT domain-containing protein/Tfp pilus assembly protein PilF
LADLYVSQQLYAQAERLHERALTIREKAFGSESLEITSSLTSLSGMRMHAGDFQRAEELLKRVLSIREKALGPDDPAVATTQNNLARVYENKGDYARAEPLFRRALEIREKAYGPNDSEVAESLRNLGNLYASLGEFSKAEPLLMRALTIIDKVYGAMHLDMAEIFTSLGRIYYARGDIAHAGFWFTQALAIREKLLGPEHVEVANALNSLAVLYHHKADYERALPLYERALAIYEKTPGPDFEITIPLENLGPLYHANGDYERAEALLKRALAIREQRQGPDNPGLTTVLNNFCRLYTRKAEYEQAEGFCRRAQTIIEKAYGPAHPELALILNNLANLSEAKGDYAGALVLLKRAIDIEEKNAVLNLASSSPGRKQLYLDQFYGTLVRMVSLQAQHLPRNDAAKNSALTIILQRKGRAVDNASDQIATLRLHADPKGKELLDQFAQATARLANLQLSTDDGKLSPSAKRDAIEKLIELQEALGDAISQRSAEFRTAAKPITLEAVRQALPAGGALVELVVFHPFNPKAKTRDKEFGTPRYAAYVLRREDDIPQFVELGDEAVIAAAATRFRAALQTSTRPIAEVKALASKLDELVMKPVRKLLGSTKRVFICPDGALNLVPFDALVDEDGHYLIENYSFNYLTSGRDLLRLQTTEQSRDQVTIVADPRFNLRNAAPIERPVTKTTDTGERSIDFANLNYSPLAGTAAEAKAIGNLLLRSRLWLQTEATEARLKSVNGPRILHVATHGFFFSDQSQPVMTLGRQLLRLETDASPPENPMLRSGLILAGVNQKQSGAGEDGVLTALEAAGLNLFGTKLVVLSACESGLGDVQNSTGVYGLRRALVLAGSETQVISLWKVSDVATRDLMIAYYTRLQAGEGRIAAMREVQLSMLSGNPMAQAEDAKSDWRHPYYWAAFIPSGAWTTLDGKEPVSRANRQ